MRDIVKLKKNTFFQDKQGIYNEITALSLLSLFCFKTPVGLKMNFKKFVKSFLANFCFDKYIVADSKISTVLLESFCIYKAWNLLTYIIDIVINVTSNVFHT